MGRSTDDEAVIAIRLHSVGQLFHVLDPSPLPDKDLDPKVEEYVVGWVRETPSRQRIAIALEVPASALNDPHISEIELAVRRYFAGRAERLRLDLRELFREGRRSLMVGLPILTACVVVSQLVRQHTGASTIGHIVGESLLILGWVANWRPLEIFLYAWWPVRRRLALHRRLAVARVEVRPSEPVGHVPGDPSLARP